ncbi:serine hydrolase [Paenibacillus sp. 5J-6]|uniref:Serine hydrolase n=1 Tax=Paenibacillus silvestris TaxID=2606219 RepID=A0A6L8UVC9_9BACL|nr:serine hydrolase domain-containing protein [Paenibacillus silvestris]MZQ81070.1 serine hydrolase [Paenibacillus silvestris]
MTIVYKSIFACLICMFLAAFISILPAAAVESQGKAAIVDEIDNYVKKTMKVNHISGASLSIAYGEDVFYTQGYGEYADGRKITNKTIFPIASLSKSITALAVLQLADKGLIDLDAPYVSYFSNISPTDERVNHITIRNLLNQTSGLNDKVNPDMTKSVQFRTLQEINDSMNTVKLAADPGSTYYYHNPNYQFLALLVEQISGQRFSEYLHDHIFTPVGMKDTYDISTTQQIIENNAIPQGHYLLLGKPIRKAEPLWFIDGPAGIISTAEDMAKWMLAQYKGNLLAPELMEQYHTAGQRGPYGMGWLVEEEGYAGWTISHSGIFWTYKAEETIYLDQQLGITMMFNSGINTFVDYSAFVDGIAGIMNGEKAGITIFNTRNMEAFIILLVIATILRGVYMHFRISRSRKGITTRKLILSSFGTLFPILILLFLSPLTTFIGGGRVVPWFGLWTTMPSLLIWLAVLTLANITNWVYRFRLHDHASKRTT